MALYLLHFTQPLTRSRPGGGKPVEVGHYLGYTPDHNLHNRIETHREGMGARICAAVVERGGELLHVRTWEGGDYYHENWLKSQHINAGHLCPVCNPKGWANRAKNLQRKRSRRGAK